MTKAKLVWLVTTGKTALQNYKCTELHCFCKQIYCITTVAKFLVRKLRVLLLSPFYFFFSRVTCFCLTSMISNNFISYKCLADKMHCCNPTNFRFALRALSVAINGWLGDCRGLGCSIDLILLLKALFPWRQTRRQFPPSHNSLHFPSRS